MAPKQSREDSPGDSINSEIAICNCPSANELSQNREHYFKCCRYRCPYLQHRQCRTGDRAKETDVQYFLCNKCRTAEMKDLEKTIAMKNETIQAYEDAINRKSDELHEITLQVLWRHYCHLPDYTATQTVKEACALKFENGRMVPQHSSPASWIQAVEKNLEEMTDAYGEKLYKVAVNEVFDAEEMNMRLLDSLREIALKLVHDGAWKGQRQKLGVVGEILGYEIKGAVWRG